MTPTKTRKPIPKSAVKVFPDGREVCDTDKATGLREYKRRLSVMLSRQNHNCAYCGTHINPFSSDVATFDHQGGRGMGGSKRDDRIEVNGQWQNAALHLYCNTSKGSRSFVWEDGKYISIRLASSPD